MRLPVALRYRMLKLVDALEVMTGHGFTELTNWQQSTITPNHENCKLCQLAVDINEILMEDQSENQRDSGSPRG